MNNKLDLKSATYLLAELTKDPSAKNDVIGIIMAGYKNELPIHWFNDLKISTYISDFTGDLRATHNDGPQRLTHTSLRELAVAESITVIDFQFTDQDFDLLQKIKGTATDDDGNLLGYRHPTTTNGTVTVSRDHLFVYSDELKAYADKLTAETKSKL